MRVNRAISVTRLRPNIGKAAAKPRRENTVSRLIFIRLKQLRLMLVHLSGLRFRCGKLRATGRGYLRLNFSIATAGCSTPFRMYNSPRSGLASGRLAAGERIMVLGMSLATFTLVHVL